MRKHPTCHPCLGLFCNQQDLQLTVHCPLATDLWDPWAALLLWRRKDKRVSQAPSGQGVVFGSSSPPAPNPAALGGCPLIPAHPVPQAGHIWAYPTCFSEMVSILQTAVLVSPRRVPHTVPGTLWAPSACWVADSSCQMLVGEEHLHLFLFSLPSPHFSFNFLQI